MPITKSKYKTATVLKYLNTAQFFARYAPDVKRWKMKMAQDSFTLRDITAINQGLFQLADEMNKGV